MDAVISPRFPPAVPRSSAGEDSPECFQFFATGVREALRTDPLCLSTNPGLGQLREKYDLHEDGLFFHR